LVSINTSSSAAWRFLSRVQREKILNLARNWALMPAHIDWVLSHPPRLRVILNRNSAKNEALKSEVGIESTFCMNVSWPNVPS
jgi:hypothetical protein